MASIGKRLELAHPNMPAGFVGFGINVVSLDEHNYRKTTRPALWLIAAVAVCIFLIAVTSFTNLLLARLESRDHEFGVRSALGAGASQLARQVVMEASRLAALGALCGMAIACGGEVVRVRWVRPRP